MQGKKRYEYVTGNIEFAIRVNNGEPFFVVLEELKKQWTPGNEYLWDEYDIESLIHPYDRRRFTVNQLIYSRITIYRALREKGKDIRGEDPFLYLKEAKEEVQRLKEMFPDIWPVI